MGSEMCIRDSTHTHTNTQVSEVTTWCRTHLLKARDAVGVSHVQTVGQLHLRLRGPLGALRDRGRVLTTFWEIEGRVSTSLLRGTEGECERHSGREREGRVSTSLFRGTEGECEHIDALSRSVGALQISIIIIIIDILGGRGRV